MDMDELAERRAANERRSRASEQLELLLKTWHKDSGFENQEIFTAAWNTLWAEHRAATLRRAELWGESLELAELHWRDYRANFNPVDPSVKLTASEQATLKRLEAIQRAEIEELKQQNAATLARIEELQKLKHAKK